MVDAGHGGTDPGAVGSKITESKLTLQAAKELEKKNCKVLVSKLI